MRNPRYETWRRAARPAYLLIAAGVIAAAAGAAPAAGPRGKKIGTVDGDPVIRVLSKDAIPSDDHPEMIPAAEAGSLLRDDEPVLGVFDGREARAYPTWHLDGHEIVNDRLGRLPIAATW